MRYQLAVLPWWLQPQAATIDRLLRQTKASELLQSGTKNRTGGTAGDVREQSATMRRPCLLSTMHSVRSWGHERATLCHGIRSCTPVVARCRSRPQSLLYLATCTADLPANMRRVATGESLQWLAHMCAACVIVLSRAATLGVRTAGRASAGQLHVSHMP